MAHEKAHKDAPKESGKSAGSLASKISHVLVRDLKKGDKVLYPGNKVIPVDTVLVYANVLDQNPNDEDLLLIVLFEGQPVDVPRIAFAYDAKVYTYAD